MPSQVKWIFLSSFASDFPASFVDCHCLPLQSFPGSPFSVRALLGHSLYSGCGTSFVSSSCASLQLLHGPSPRRCRLNHDLLKYIITDLRFCLYVRLCNQLSYCSASSIPIPSPLPLKRSADTADFNPLIQ